MNETFVALVIVVAIVVFLIFQFIQLKSEIRTLKRRLEIANRVAEQWKRMREETRRDLEQATIKFWRGIR